MSADSGINNIASLVIFGIAMIAVVYFSSNDSEENEKKAAEAFCNSQPSICECTVHVSHGRYSKHYYATYKYGKKWFTREFDE